MISLSRPIPAWRDTGQFSLKIENKASWQHKISMANLNRFCPVPKCMFYLFIYRWTRRTELVTYEGVIPTTQLSCRLLFFSSELPFFRYSMFKFDYISKMRWSSNSHFLSGRGQDLGYTEKLKHLRFLIKWGFHVGKLTRNTLKVSGLSWGSSILTPNCNQSLDRRWYIVE